MESELQIKKFKSIVLCILSAVLLALPFCNGKLWIFAWIGFVPLFLSLRNKSRTQAFLLAYLTGIIFWSITIYWLINVTLLGQILLILYLSLYFGMFGIIITFHLPPSTFHLLFIPSSWVILEYLRSHLLTGFGWALLGYSQYLNLPIIQIADILGVWGVSSLVMMVNWALYSITSHKSQATSYKNILLFSVLCSLFSLSYGYYKLNHSPFTIHQLPIKISVIQGNIPQELKWASGQESFILDRYRRLTRQAALERPDLIIWPEASAPAVLGEDDLVFQDIFALARDLDTPILVGSAVKENGEYFNSGLLISNQGKILSRYDKLHLVPFGEYIPLKNVFRFLETIVPIGDFISGKEYSIFKLQASSFKLSANFAVLICFEDTIPELSRNFVSKGADFLVNITNDGWFGKTSAASQHLSSSVFRAVENRVPVARSANTGISCFIDSSGRIKSRVSEGGEDIFIQGFKSESIILKKQNSLYGTIGDGFVLVCLAVIIFYGIILIQKEPKN